MSSYWDERFLKHIDISNSRIVVEVGARYGDESKTLANIFSNAHIYSFECNPLLTETCKTKLSDISNVTFFDIGLGDKETILPFYHYHADNDGASSLYKRIDYNNTQKYIGDVCVKTLQSVMNENNINHIDLLCMDVQGFELNILKGCGDFLENINFIIMEEPVPKVSEIFLPKGVHSHYIGAPTSQEIKTFMNSHHFFEVERIRENFTEDNVMYKRVSSSFYLQQEQEITNSFIRLQEFMENKFQCKEPFFIGRLSGNETSLAGKILSNKPTIQINRSLVYNMLSGSGIRFKNDQDLIDYAKEYYNSILNCNMLGVFDGIVGDQAKEINELLDKSKAEIEKFNAVSFEFFTFLDKPFYKIDSIFENKTILVILSHEETLKHQLNKLDLIYPDENNIRNQGLFRNTKFITYKPAQQHCGLSDGQSWKVHMDKMKQDLSKLVSENNIDVVFASCGGFSMILSDYIYKELKTSVIYAGGVLQLFFGILGERWISHFPRIMKLSNSHWIRPLDVDTPKSKKKCENGCYW
jgi:FkbM family methyltransferase